MQRDLNRLPDHVFDLFIVGGGSSGAGIALDAASRGLRVALIDKGDFASATSSASSKLVHGGLRYLEHGGLRLVHEALTERRRLLKNAPHLVRPLRFIMPFYRGSRLPRWKGRVGLMLYDVLSGSQNLKRSRDLPARWLRRDFPALRTDNLLSGVEYFDAQMEDARLGLAIVQTAVRFGAVACNYVEATGFDLAKGRIGIIQLRDALTGEALEVRARHVLNAAGPWVDALRRLAGISDVSPLLEPTKGVHIIVAGKPYAPNDNDRSRETAFTFLHPRDGRVFFVLPWMGHTLLGTTDTFCDESADRLSISTDEENYLLEGYNHHFSNDLGSADIKGRFAGLRPLLRSTRNEPSSRSREYRLIEDANGLLSVAGGKWTTYRHMAEVVTDRIAEKLGRKTRCRTAARPLDGTPDEAWTAFSEAESVRIPRKFGLNPASASHLVARYGMHAPEVAKMIVERDENRPVIAGEPDLIGEWEYQRRHEMAMTREDLVLRRSRIGLWHPELLTR